MRIDMSKMLYGREILVMEIVKVSIMHRFTLHALLKIQPKKRRIRQKGEFNVFDQQRQSIPLQCDFRHRLALDEYLARLWAH